MEIETDKTTVGVPTPVSGVIEEIFVKDGDTVKAGQDLFKIKAGPVSGKAAAPAKAAEPPKPVPAAPTPAPKPAAAAAPPPPPPPPTPRATPPPPPPRPQAPASTVPIAAIRHAQAVEASVKVIRIITCCWSWVAFFFRFISIRRCHLLIIREKLQVPEQNNV